MMVEETDGMDETMPLNGIRVMGADQGASSQGPSSRAATAAPESERQAAPPKRRMVITHDKYMTLRSLIVLHLQEHERQTGVGLDHDELVDWYLEQKEESVQDIEELEFEKELVTKMLRKLLKVRSTLYMSCCCLHFSFVRITTFWPLKEMSENLFPPKLKPNNHLRYWMGRICVYFIWCTHRSTQKGRP